jgi:tetratricopeptide (TPR) repeat protein
MRKILILLLFGCFCFSEEIILDREITEKKIEELEKIKEGTKDPEILKKIYPVLIEKYDKQAEYGKKHRSMKEYAEILYPEKEKQVEYLKNEADKLREQGEIGEAIMIYNTIKKNYSLPIIPEVLITLGDIWEKDLDYSKALEEYITGLNAGLEKKDKEEILFRLGRAYMKLGKNKEAVETFEKFLIEYPGSLYQEEVVFNVGRTYYNKGEKDKAEEKFNQYLEKYPNGKYAGEVKFLLKFLSEGR